MFVYPQLLFLLVKTFHLFPLMEAKFAKEEAATPFQSPLSQKLSSKNKGINMLTWSFPQFKNMQSTFKHSLVSGRPTFILLVSSSPLLTDTFYHSNMSETSGSFSFIGRICIFFLGVYKEEKIWLISFSRWIPQTISSSSINDVTSNACWSLVY